MLGLYIHIPFCVTKCKYCDFNSFKIDLNEKIKYLNFIFKVKFIILRFGEIRQTFCIIIGKFFGSAYGLKI